MVLFLGLLLFQARAQEQVSGKEFKTLMDEGIEAKDQKDYTQAIKKLTQAEAIAERKNLPRYLWNIRNNLGISFTELSNYGKGLEYYHRALEVINENPELYRKRMYILNNIGNLVGREDTDRAIEYLKKALDEAEEYDSEKFMQKLIAVNLAEKYHNQGKYDKAEAVLLKVKPIPTKPWIMQGWKIMYAKNLFYRGKIGEALKKAKIMEQETLAGKKDICHICVLDLLANIYQEKGDFDQAVYYTNQVLVHDSSWNSKIFHYAQLAELYGKKNDLRHQLAYKDSVILAKDSLSHRMNRKLFQANRVQMNVQQYQNELALNKEAQKGQQRLFWVALIGLLLLLVLVYFWQKNRIAKQRQEKTNSQNREYITRLALDKEKKERLLTQTQLKNQQAKAKIKQEQFKNKIAQKNRKLATKALYLTERNRLIKNMVDDLKHFEPLNSNRKIQHLVRSLKDELHTEKEWEDFVAHFEEINPNFIKRLKQKHPKLSNSDLRFISYYYMNFTLQEIATVMGITLEASKKRKQGIAKKMHIPTQAVSDYLVNLE